MVEAEAEAEADAELSDYQSWTRREIPLIILEPR